MNEFELIARFFSPLSGAGAFGLKDDAAVIPAQPGFDLVVTTDAIAEGADFFADDPADGVAKKALRVNLSDLAAKGAAPFGYLLNLSLPPDVTEEWLARFASGLEADQRRYGLSLLGGDTGRGPLTIIITAFGFVPEGGMIRRDGARPGDDVYVTGTVGDSGGGLALCRGDGKGLDAEQRAFLIGHYRLPEPPMALGPRLCGVARASVDISDGLVADLAHVARASGVRLAIEAKAIPRTTALRALWGDGAEAILRAATAGDDYQIAFTAAADRAQEVMVEAGRNGTTVTRIGSVTAGEGVALLLNGEELAVPRPGYRHF